MAANEREGIARGTALTVPGAHVPAEIALHATSTSRLSKSLLRIAWRSLPQRFHSIHTAAEQIRLGGQQNAPGLPNG
jgi:hypothetical protein